MRASCLLALFGRGVFDDEDAEVDASAGALALAAGLHELESIRRLLTPKQR